MGNAEKTVTKTQGGTEGENAVNQRKKEKEGRVSQNEAGNKNT